jgi:hypothetical protein
LRSNFRQGGIATRPDRSFSAHLIWHKAERFCHTGLIQSARNLSEFFNFLIPAIVPPDEGRRLINIKDGVRDHVHKHAMNENLTSASEVCPVFGRPMIDIPYKFNEDALTSLARFVTVTGRLRSEIAERVTETQEAIIQARALMAKADASLAANATRPGWLWPAY